MRVMVTGGGGFIGRAVVELLGERGHDAVVFDWHSTGVDVRDKSALGVHALGCDAVIHLAGVLGTEELFAAAHTAVDVNVHGTLNVLETAASHGLGYVGITMPEVWDNVYQATKKCGRILASAWHRHHGLSVSHVRAYNAFGEGQKVMGVQKIVPTFAARAWRGQPIPIWGDGTQTVDLVYVGDLARMLVDAIGFGDDEVFDGGTGQAMTVQQVAEMVLEITGSKAGIEYLPMRLGEHETKIVADGNGWDALGWKPEFRFAEFERTVAWYRDDRP